MSGVDVLAVMDRAVENLQDAGGIGNTIGLKNARAAVAELIEANLEFDAAHLAWDVAPGFALSIGDVDGRDFDGPEYARLFKAIDRRESALTRVTGGES